jgi:hypothetical protein
MNAREIEILNLISNEEATNQPLPWALWVALKPGAPLQADMIAVATETATSEVTAAILAYCKKDPEYAQLLERYQRNRPDKPKPRSVPTPALPDDTQTRRGSAETDIGLTALSRNSERWAELHDRLIPWVDQFLAIIALPAEQGIAFLSFVKEQLPVAAHRRFGDELVTWLREFAARHDSKSIEAVTTHSIREAIEAAAVRRVLSLETKGEPSWAREFRTSALNQNPTTILALQAIELGDNNSNRVWRFHRDLVREAEMAQLKALADFEIA